MPPKSKERAEYNEDERKSFLLGFHNRKQEKKLEYLTKKALKEKRERALEKIARKRKLLEREKKYGLLDEATTKKKVDNHDLEDEFSKNMFGTEEVTVTVEYSGDEEEDANGIENDEQLLKEEEDAENKESDEDLNEQEQTILDNVKLSSGEMRKLKELANAKRKHKKGKKRAGRGRKRR